MRQWDFVHCPPETRHTHTVDPVALRHGAGVEELARRGWEVTGVDIVPKALRRARERVEAAGVEVRLVEGDVTRLGAAGVGFGFPFLIDFGLFHDELNDEQRAAMGRCRGAPVATRSRRPIRHGR